MARHGKTIKTIENMYKKLSHSKNQVRTTRNNTEVYRMEKNGFEIELYHYGTRTLAYDLQEKRIMDCYGESVSDRDSMNTLLDCVGHDESEFFRFGPVLGFVLEGPEMDEESFDDIGFIMAYEKGELNESEIVEGFQKLIESGLVWNLDEKFTVHAETLIDLGKCTA